MTGSPPVDRTDSSAAGEFRGYSAGIVTFMDGKNYGCDLQRYAMQRVLKRLGLRALLIDYAPPREGARPGPVRRLLRTFSPRSLARGALSLFDRRDAAFRRFNGEMLEKTGPVAGYGGLSRLAPFDCYIAGSDQIWNPGLTRGEGGRRFFFLDFAPAGTKISYAPSLGVSRVDPGYAARLKESLASFSWISVREREGAEIIQKILNRPVDVVLDPTMLLSAEEWDRLAGRAERFPVQEEKYILCYSLGNTAEILAEARRLAPVHGARIAPICYSLPDALRLKKICPECRPVLNAGPAEFVSLIRSAAAVVTDSFHGTVFSILYRRPFRTMMRDRREGASSMNSRVRTLLETFHLQDRLFGPEAFAGGPAEETDDAADEILRRYREESLNKLKDGLRKVLIHEESGRG